MTQQDDRILEFLAAEGWATPRLVAREASIHVSAGVVEERLHFLGYAGFVDRIHGDTYEITRWGHRYLDGDIDAAHQPRPTVDRVLRG